MSEENKEAQPLAPVQNMDMAAYHQAQDAALAKQSDSQFADLAKGADYLCRVQLCGSNSNLTKNDLVKKGDYAFIINKDKFINLGQSVDVYPITWRPRAIDMNESVPVSFFNPDADNFKDVQKRAGVKNSKCTYGPDFLIWVPSIKKFATLHFGSASARQDAPDLMKLMKDKKASTLTWKKCGPNKDGQIWETIVVNACSTPFEPPPLEDFTKTIGKFMDETKAVGPVKSDADKDERQR